MCEEWREFLPFYNWAKTRWRPGLQLDRKDNNGNYSPDNCRFTSSSVNNINQRKPRNNTSGYVGVSWIKSIGMYHSCLGFKPLGGNIYLGAFHTKEAAVTARNNFIIKHKLPHKIQEID